MLKIQGTLFIFWPLIDNFKTDMEVLEADMGETLLLSEEWKQYQVLLISPVPSNSYCQFLLLDLSLAVNSYMLPLQNSQDIFPELHKLIKQRVMQIFCQKNQSILFLFIIHFIIKLLIYRWFFPLYLF